MQYYQPKEHYLFVGDPMPFFHDGVYRFYYLVDPDHHMVKGRIGAAEVAHSSTRDLINWEHHPLAIPTGPPGAADQLNICTGAAFFHEGTYYFWYATRMLPEGGSYKDHTQHVCLATSTDGIHYEKDPGNPILNADAHLNARHFRDPVVFQNPDTGLFHMLVTSQLAEEPLFFRNGALAHLTSTDLRNWQWQEPFLVPGLNTAPECPDHFEWNGWYYLTFLVGGRMRYRMSRNPLGPWHRPRIDTVDGTLLKAMKTATFTGGRRIGAGFLSSRVGYEDGAKTCYAGNAVFREIIQNEDGTLSACWPKEMIPASGESVAISPMAVTGDMRADGNDIQISSPEGYGACFIEGVPDDARVTMKVTPAEGTHHCGLDMRASGNCLHTNEVRFSPFERSVCVRNFQMAPPNIENTLLDVDGLDKPFTIDIVQTDSVVDLVINGNRTFINRLYQNHGDRLYFFVENGSVEFSDIDIRPLKGNQ